MSELFKKIKTPFIIIVVLVVLFIVYNSATKKSTTTAVLTKQASSTAPDKDFLPLLLSIQNVTLDPNLFLDPVFRGLLDLGQPIKPETIGKNNPFGVAKSSGVVSSVESLGFKEEKATTTGTVIKVPVKK